MLYIIEKHISFTFPVSNLFSCILCYNPQRGHYLMGGTTIFSLKLVQISGILRHTIASAWPVTTFKRLVSFK